jgi:hypothetical protein
MFGFDPDSVEAQPVEIDGEVYVPMYQNPPDGPEMFIYIKYSVIEENMPGSGFDTDDFRIN